MVRAIGGEHLRAPGVQPCHSNRVLDRVGTTVRKKNLIQLGTCTICDPLRGLAPGFDGMLRCHRRQNCGLSLDRRNHLWVLESDIGENQLRSEIKKPIAIKIPEVGAKTPGHR